MATTTGSDVKIDESFIKEVEECIKKGVGTPSVWRIHKGKKERTWYHYDAHYSKLTRKVQIGSKVSEYISTIPSTKTLKASERAPGYVGNKMRKLLRSGWVTKEEDASEYTVFRPMLFKHWIDHKHKMKYPVVVQPKFDGVRCLWFNNQLVSKSGKLYDLPHIKDTLKASGIKTSLDGEICYEDIRPLSEVIEGISEKDPDLKFFIFDTTLTLKEQTYQHRLKTLMSYVGLSPVLKVVPTFIAKSEEHVNKFYEEYVTQGFEGIMVKSLDSKYERNKRVDTVLKYKHLFEGHAHIIGTTYDPHPHGNLISFMLSLDLPASEDTTFKCTPAWSHKERREFDGETFAPLLHGVVVEIEYRGVSKDKIPFHAVMKTTPDELTKQLKEKLTALFASE